MFVSRHRTVVEGVSKLRAFGVDRSHTERSLPGMYDVPTLGFNYRMSEIQAALGRTQLHRIEENLKRRRSNFDALKQRLTPLPGLRVLDNTRSDLVSSHYCLVAVLEDGLAERRNEIAVRLNQEGVGTSIYYPHPVPRMRYYREKYGYEATRFTRAAEISDHSLALPVGPHIQREDVEYMGDTLARILEEMRG